MKCQTWSCQQPAISQLTTRRPCGHPVALNNSGQMPTVRDGSPARQVQRTWHCRTHVLERAGRPAPGPSTCPTCGVREPVTTDGLAHAPHPLSDVPVSLLLCRGPIRSGESIVYDRFEPVTCPDCLEWMHA